MFPENQLSRWGAISKMLPMTYGKVFLVANVNDAWVGDLLSEFPPDRGGVVRVMTSLSAAYDACVSGRNDVILLDGNSSHAVTTGLNWTKSRINVIGIGNGNRLTDQGAKVSLSGAVDSAYVIKVTGTRNSFKNVKFIQSSTHANALTVAQMGGEGNVYENCSFIFGVADNLGSTSASEVVCGEDSGTFIDCEFGADTLLTTAARIVFLVKTVTSGQEFKSNRLRCCTFKISSSSSSALLLKVNSTADVLFTNLFEDCNFYASVDSAGGVALTNAVSSVASLVKGTLAFARSAVFFCTNFSASNSTNFQVTGPAVSTNAFEGATPA